MKTSSHIADAHAKSSLRKLQRQRRKRANIYRICEASTIVILWITFLLHLLSNTSNAATSEIQSRRSLSLAKNPETIATQQVTPVPEPSTLTLVAASMVAIYFRRRKQQSSSPQGTAFQAFHPSRIAIAAA